MNRFLLTIISLSALLNSAVSLNINSAERSKCSTQPICPKDGDLCIYQGDIAYNFGMVDTPECWVKKGNSTPECYRKLIGGKCDLNEHTQDVSKCPGFVKEPTKPVCPKVGDLCIYQGDIAFNFGMKDTPECWVRKGTTTAECHRKPAAGTCDQDKFTQDVSKCPGFVQEPTKPTEPECPKVGTTCIYQGDIAYAFGVFKDVPECWEKTGETSYKCDRKVNGKCAKDTDKDVSSCPGYKN